MSADRKKEREWTRLFRLSAFASMAAGLVLALAPISLIVTTLQSRPGFGWFSALAGIWLIVIFKIHAGLGGASVDLLTGVHLPDLALLALVGTLNAGLYVVLRKTSKVWSVVAAVQPWLGIMLLLATRTAGRSAIMGAVLVASLVMLRSAVFGKAVAWIGAPASLLLLAGDFAAGAIPPSPVMAVLFGIGYVLLEVWFFLIGYRLVRLMGSSQYVSAC